MDKIAIFLSAKLDMKQLNKYHLMLKRIKNQDVLSKIMILLENPRLKKSNKFWALKLDKAEITPTDLKTVFNGIKQAFMKNLPVKNMLSKILDYGLVYGPIKLERVLGKNQIRLKILKLEESIETKEEISDEYKLLHKEMKRITKSFKISEEPSANELRNLKDSDPDDYKIVIKIKNEKRKALTSFRNNIFKDSTDPIDIKEYNKTFNKFGLNSNISNKFNGKINKDGTLLTPDNKKLINLMGSDVLLNDKYDPKTDDTYYCRSLNNQGNIVYHYTEDYCNRKNKEKFAHTLEFGEKIQDIREQVTLDLESNSVKRYYATIVSLIDQAYFRIGNIGSTKEKGTQGLTTLKVKNVTIKDNEVHFDYTGKDFVLQHKVVTDEIIINNIKKMIENKSPEDFVFTFKGNRIDASEINSYLKKDLNSPVTVHKFRTYHATRLTKEAVDKLSNVDSEKIMDNLVKELENIALKLGHTSYVTTVKHYIDNTVIKDFLSTNGLELPKVLENTVNAFVRDLFRKSAGDKFVFDVSSVHTITKEEEKFNNYMQTMKPEIIES